MSDKEPRRRKKRKDSAKKDDMRSDDPIFMPVRTESKDSDPELEEEAPLPIHQPSAFAKLVFIILFSGLIVSMSFIFISLHGTDRGSVDLFDDHHSDEHISIESIEQIENINFTSDTSEESEHSNEEENAHEEVEPWSSSEFLPENLLNMLPNIGNILSFNNDKEDKLDTPLTVEDNIKGSDILEELQKSSEAISNQEKSSDPESDIKNHEDEHSEDISNQHYFEYSTESPQNHEDTNNDIIEEVIDPPVKVKPSTEKSSFEEDLSQFAEEQYSQDFSSSLDASSKPVAEQEDYSDEILFTDNKDVFEEQLSSHVPQDFETTPDYEEEDRLSYEKAFITNEDDYGFREELDELDALLGKRLPDEDNSNDNDENDIDDADESEEINNDQNGDDDEDDDDDEEDENDDEPGDEFDFWQF